MDFKKEFVSTLKKGRKIATLVAAEIAQATDQKGIEGKLRKTLGCQCAETGEYEKAIEYQKEACEIAEERGNTEDKGNACRYLGESYFKTGDYGLSIYYCNEYLEIASCDSREEACAKKFLGLSHHNLGQNSNAIPHLERCLELFERLGDNEEIAEANSNLGIAYRDLGEYEKAKEKLNKCLWISEEWEFQTLTQQMFVELGCVYKAMNQHTSAAKYFQLSLRLANELQDKAKIAKAYNYLAEAYLSQHQPQDAIYYLKEACTRCDRLTTRLSHVRRLGSAYLMNKQPNEAIACFEDYLRMSANEADSSEQANVNIKMGKSYAECGKNEIAIGYYLKGLELIEPLGEKMSEVEAHEGLGDAYYKTTQYNDAQKHYNEALEIANAQDDKELKGRVYIKLGNVFRVQENIQEAFPYYHEALMIAESIGGKEMEADAYEGLGKAFYSTSEHEIAIENHNKNLQLAIDLVDKKRQQQAHENLGNAYFAWKKWSEASESYESCCAIATAYEDIAAVYRCERKMGNAYFENEDYDNAILYHKRCLEKATQLNDNPGETESYRVIGCSYSKIKQPKNALEYYDKFFAMVDTTMDNFELATVYLDAGKLCTECGVDEKAIRLYRECLNLVKGLGNLKLKQEALEKLGDTYYKNSKYDEAYEHYFEIDQLSIKEPDRRCQIYYKLGKADFSRKNIQMAIEFYYTALDFVRDENIQADIWEALGDAFYLDKDYENAITYHTQNLEFANRILDEKRQQRAYESLGDAYSAREQWLLAVENYLYSCAKVGDDKERVVQCERKLGNAYYQVKNYEKAIECLENANKRSQLKEKYDIIGRAYVKIGQYNKAMQFLSMDLIIDQDDKLRQARAQGNIGRLYVKTGKFQNAIECHQKALELVQQSKEAAEAKAAEVKAAEAKAAEAKAAEAKATEAKAAEAKAAEAEVYCNLGCAYQANGQYEEAMEFQMKFLQLAENLEDKSQQGRAHKKIANIHFATGEHDRTINSYYECLEVVENTEKSTRVRVLGKLGCVWRSISQHEMAIGCHEDQAHVANNLKDKARALENLGTDYELNGDYAKALEYQRKYLEIAKKMDDDAEQGHAYVNIGKLHLAKGEYEEAIRKSEIAEKLANKAYTGLQCEMTNDMHRKEMDIIQIEANSNIGMGHVGTGDYDKAVVCFRKQMRLAKEIGDKRKVGRANENFGNYHAAVGECNEAISFYNKSLEIAKEIGDKAWIGRAKGCMGATLTEIGQYQNAVECHEEEIKIAKDLGNKVREGQALGNLGNAYTGLCEYQKAIKLHEESLKIAEECDVQADQRRANRNLGNAYLASGQYQKALDFQVRALKFSQQLGHKAAEGRIHESMARAYYLSGHIETSIESSEKSLSIACKVGDRAGKGRALGTLSNAYIDFGQNYRTAISNLREYLRISEELSNEADKGDALGSMAAVLIEIGQYNKALECCDESLKIAKNLKDKAREGRAYGNFGKFYTAVGRYEEAIDNHRKHLNIATELGDEAEMGRANGNLGNAYNANGQHINANGQHINANGQYRNANGQYRNAMECHTIDKDIADKLRNDARVARAQGNMGNTYTNIGQFEKALNCHLERLHIAKKLDDKPSLAKALLGLGVHHIKTDQFEKAIECLDRLEEISRPTHLGSRELIAIAQELLGKCYERDQVPKACSFFAKSIINFQTIRDSLRDHDEFNISMSNRFAHVHKLLLRSLLNMKEVKTALLVSDCGKAQALSDLMWKMVHSDLGFPFKDCDPMETIANGPSSVASEKLFNESLYNVINSNQADTIISYAFGEDDELHSWVISQGRVFHKTLKITNQSSMSNYLHSQITLLNQQLNVKRAQVDAQADASQDVKAVHDFEARACNPLWLMSDDIESDQKRLADTCSPEHDHSTTPQERGASSTASARRTVQNSHLRDLYTTLIQPIEEHLTGSRLLIVPDGPLFTLPFAALLDPSGSHLCDKYSLQFIPSLHVLNFCLSTPPVELGPALFVGNPVIGEACLDGEWVKLDSLPSAEDEVTKCGKHFNAQPLVMHMATKENVLNGMKTASVIHIAAHGSVNRAEIFLTPNEGASPACPSCCLKFLL